MERDYCNRCGEEAGDWDCSCIDCPTCDRSFYSFSNAEECSDCEEYGRPCSCCSQYFDRIDNEDVCGDCRQNGEGLC